jgi:hypothetical protein
MDKIPKKKLAQERNWAKFRITGTLFNYNGVTKKEIEALNKMYALRKQLLDNWDEGSRELGLNVPSNKCFVKGCRKEATTIIIHDGLTHTKACRMHGEEEEARLNKTK